MLFHSLTKQNYENQVPLVFSSLFLQDQLRHNQASLPDEFCLQRETAITNIRKEQKPKTHSDSNTPLSSHPTVKKQGFQSHSEFHKHLPSNISDKSSATKGKQKPINTITLTTDIKLSKDEKVGTDKN